MKNTLIYIILLLPCIIFAQDSTEWVSTEGIIKDIEIKRSGRRVREMALVAFQTKNGEPMTTYVQLNRIPLLGSLKSKGDTINVNYDKNNPAIAQTDTGKFISQYGLYILIGLGIIFSLKNVLRAIKFKNINGQNT